MFDKGEFLLPHYIRLYLVIVIPTFERGGDYYWVFRTDPDEYKLGPLLALCMRGVSISGGTIFIETTNRRVRYYLIIGV
jgi:hypothetical protein